MTQRPYDHQREATNAHFDAVGLPSDHNHAFTGLEENFGEGAHFDSDRGVAYIGNSGGMPRTSKGDALVKMIEHARAQGRSIDSVTFVDDATRHLDSVQEALEKLGVEVKVIHFLGNEGFEADYQESRFRQDFHFGEYVLNNILQGPHAELLRQEYPEEFRYLQESRSRMGVGRCKMFLKALFGRQ